MPVVAVLVGYLCGSVPFGLLIARARGVDIRSVGSGNIGATNVARALGRSYGVFVLILDSLKGYTAIIIAGGLKCDSVVIAAAGLASIVGHVLPVWLKFRGGKGVATGLGVFLALAPLPTAIAFGVYAAIYGIFRISSLGSLCAATALVVAMMLFDEPKAFVALAVAAWALIVVTHRGNIQRLLRREENKV